MVKICEIASFNESLTLEASALVLELSSSAGPLTAGRLRNIIESPATTLFGAFSKAGDLLGILTLVIIEIPTGKRAIIEDVVVSKRFRGKGIGKELTRAALESARHNGVRDVNLTSRESRVEANQLYLGLGFEIRKTNVYRYNLC